MAAIRTFEQHLDLQSLGELRSPASITAVQDLTASKIVLTNGSKDIVSSTISESDLVTASSTNTFTNKTFDANGTGNSISNIETADIASGSKSGSDATLLTGTAGTSGNLAQWNADGDAVDSSLATSAVATKVYADAKVADAINDGTTTIAPSQNAVFDALALKADLASPALTGVPTAPTATSGTNTTQLATTAFVTAAVTGGVTYIGSIDCSTNPNYPASTQGDLRVVSVAGKIGGAAGESVQVGDFIFCNTTSAGGDEAAVGSEFDVIQGNDIDVAALAGAGLVVNGAALDVNVDDSTVEIDSDTVQLKDGGTTFVKLATDAKPHSETFNGTTDWTSSVLTITAATHGLGTAVQAEFLLMELVQASTVKMLLTMLHLMAMLV